MKWTGVIIEESLKDRGLLKDTKIINTRVENVSDATTGQPSVWHLHDVTVEDEKINSFCEKAKDVIKHAWYMDFKTDKEKIVIFKKKSFRIKNSDKEGEREIVDYGISLGIPRRQMVD